MGTIREQSASRRGRPTREEAARRRAQVVDAARTVLIENGYAGTTTQQIAERSGVSKESLYAWFGSKEGLFTDVIAAEGQATLEGLQRLVGSSTPSRTTLTAFARALLTLLSGPWSLAVNRGAMTAPELAAVVLQHGRLTVGPILEQVLADLAAQGELDIPDPADAFRDLYGLVVRDTQIRLLLGEPPPAPDVLARQADRGVEQFCRLYPAGSDV